jgi:predicted lipoprotein
MRTRDRAVTPRAPRTPPLSFALALGSALVAGSSLEACRKPAPDEIVNSGQFHPPSVGPVPTSGTSGAASATGGSGATTGAGARGGTSHGGSSTAHEGGEGGEPSSGGSGGSSTGSGGTSGTNGGSAGSAGSGGSGAIDPGPVCDPVVPSTEAFSKRGLLEAAGACARRQYCLFDVAAKKLDERTRGQASDPSEANANAARGAWRDAMAIWEEAEMFLFGPAAPPASPGGQGLRDFVYSWPLIARCKVDEQTVSRFYAKDTFFGSASASPTTGRTLHALEYLLFYQGLDNGCTAYSTINSTGSWALLDAEEIRRRKRDYAGRAAGDVTTHAAALVSAWSPSEGDFGRALADVQPLFASEQAALNAVSNGLFYLDKELKDTKLALPLGLDPACPAASCPTSVEGLYAGASRDHIAANLRGFRKLFQGCADANAGIGFDDWLDARGASDLRARMLAALDAADAAFASVDVSIDALITSDPARARALYDAVKAVTDLLKTEFTTVLDLTRPGPAEGDND